MPTSDSSTSQPSAPRAIYLEDGLDAALGLRLYELGPNGARAELEVHDRVRQRFGLVHGGAYCAIAEFLASECTNAGVRAKGQLGLGQQNATQFLRPVTQGTIRVDARPRHRGESSWLWDVEFMNAQAKLCALSRVLIAVREAPPGDVPPLLDSATFNRAVRGT